jgi:HK97 family phage major capsid protein
MSMSTRLQSLQTALKAKVDEFETIFAKADRSDEDNKKGLALAEEAKGLKAQIEQEQEAEKAAAAVKGLNDWLKKPADTLPYGNKGGDGAGTDPDRFAKDDGSGRKGFNDKGVRIYSGEAELDKAAPTGGFASAGHFYKAVHLQSVGQLAENPWAVKALNLWSDIRVKTALSTLDDPSAGLLVPEQFAQGIEKRMNVTENLMNRARVLPISGNSMTFFRRQDASRVDGSRHAGVTVSYEGEAQTYSQTKPKYEKYRIEADKIAALVEVTEELLSDSPYAIEMEINDLASEAIVFKASDKMVRGTGAGMPLGILNSDHRVTVAKETNQAAASLDIRNITKMWMRLDPACRANAIWMINNDVQDELDNIAFPVGTGGVPAYLPAGGLSQTGFASLKGRPVIPMEYCESLGTEGDIILVDWTYYKGVSKGGIRSDMSIHVYFERDSRCYRFVHRFGGQPQYGTQFTPYKGTTKTSSIVTLATRA